MRVDLWWPVYARDFIIFLDDPRLDRFDFSSRIREKEEEEEKKKRKNKGKEKKRIDGRINRSIGSGDDRRSQDPRRDAKRVDISILIAVTFAQVMEQREVYTTIKVCSWEKWYMLISDDT